MKPFSPEAEALLEKLPTAGDPAPEDLRRGRARLIAQLGPSALETTVSTTGAPTTAGARFGGRVLGGLTLALGVGALLYALSSNSPPTVAANVSSVAQVSPLAAPPSDPPSEILPTLETTIAEDPAQARETPASPPTAPRRPAAKHARRANAEPVTAPVPLPVTAPAPPPAPAPVPPQTSKSGNVAEELSILRRAMAALKAGDTTSALAALDEHAQRFPDGILAEERASQRVVALCNAGRVAEARAEGERFLREHPVSPGATRIRGTCFANDAGTR